MKAVSAENYVHNVSTMFLEYMSSGLYQSNEYTKHFRGALAGSQFSPPRSTVHDVQRKRLKLRANTLQVVQNVTRSDHD
jgi:hypothetical protein